MRTISDTTRSDGYGSTSRETRAVTDSSKRKIFEDLIRKANTVPLVRIFSHYNLRVDSVYSTIICPFKNHKNGRENSASFVYYPDTNSFYCFGCKIGGPFAHGCEFIAAMESISRAKAANKILKLFRTSINEDAEAAEVENFSEKLEIMLDFSSIVREYRQTHFDEKSISHLEYVCSVYDAMNSKRKLDNEALRRLVDELKAELKI